MYAFRDSIGRCRAGLSASPVQSGIAAPPSARIARAALACALAAALCLPLAPLCAFAVEQTPVPAGLPADPGAPAGNPGIGGPSDPGAPAAEPEPPAEGTTPPSNAPAAVLSVGAPDAAIPDGLGALRAAVGVEPLPEIDRLASGVCGDGVAWDISRSAGKLRVYPADGVWGRLPDLYAPQAAPWGGYAPDVRAARVHPGVEASHVLNGLFADCRNMVSCDLSGLRALDDANVSGMFRGCSSLVSADLACFRFWGVHSMEETFYGCSSLVSADLSGVGTFRVASMRRVFAGCSQLAELDLSCFDTSQVEGMEGMFAGCSRLSRLDVSRFDLSCVTSMEGMFEGCASLASCVVTDMSELFYGCASLVALDLTGLRTSNVKTMENMFRGCSALSQLVLPDGFIGPKVERVDFMFEHCASLSVLPANLAIPRNVRAYALHRMFYVNPLPGGGKLATYYAGDDPRVLSYTWSRDNRKLRPPSAA